MSLPENWWSEEYGFFGDHYLEGDNSREGYLIARQQSLEERTKTEVEGIERLVGLRTGESVLDIPCGYGRHSIGLAGRGYQVTGVDVNRVHLGRAVEAARDAKIGVEFVRSDMREMALDRHFDAAVNMFYSFGFFHSDAENREALRRIFEALKPGGRFLFHTDVNIPRILAGKYKEKECRTLASGRKLTIMDQYRQDTRRVDGCWVITNEGGLEVRKDYSMRVYERKEFVDLCRAVGFSRFEEFGDWQRSPYTEDSEDMMIVA